MNNKNEVMGVEQPHSVEFSVNAKGQWSGKVKVYASSPDDAYRIAKEYAQRIDLEIRSKNGLRD